MATLVYPPWTSLIIMLCPDSETRTTPPLNLKAQHRYRYRLRHRGRHLHITLRVLFETRDKTDKTRPCLARRHRPCLTATKKTTCPRPPNHLAKTRWFLDVVCLVCLAPFSSSSSSSQINGQGVCMGSKGQPPSDRTLHVHHKSAHTRCRITTSQPPPQQQRRRCNPNLPSRSLPTTNPSPDPKLQSYTPTPAVSLPTTYIQCMCIHTTTTPQLCTYLPAFPLRPPLLLRHASRNQGYRRDNGGVVVSVPRARPRRGCMPACLPAAPFLWGQYVCVRVWVGRCVVWGGYYYRVN